MIFFIKNFIPFTYFSLTRLNKLVYLIYHASLEWVPMIILVIYYNSTSSQILLKLLLSYFAFVSIYEIGYITNDFYSEKFEADPRGRKETVSSSKPVVWGLILSRVLFFLLFSHLLNTLNSLVWWVFYMGLLSTFIFHNVRLKENRISTFFGLSVFRFLAPLLLCLPEQIFIMLIPVIMLNYSLFRTITYGSSKKIFNIKNRESAGFKIRYFINCLPICIFFSVLFTSIIPIILCIYYMMIWILYGLKYKNRTAV